jgi:hypothetical protein
MLEGFCFAASKEGSKKKKEGKQQRNKTQMENMQSVTTWKKWQ